MKRYLAITPARDEAALLPELIESMKAQTVLPARWILIDDGSADGSGEIIDRAALDSPWVEPRHLPRSRARQPGGESVVMRCLADYPWRDYDFIVRFDADLAFRPDYIEALLKEFERDPRLGIASGCLWEPSSWGWREAKTPAYHTRGPSKVYSRACFETIGGLEAGLGWDTIDEARALMAGYHTRSFGHIRAYHRRVTGSARGLWRGRLAAGEAAYSAGYSPMFMMVRAARHSFSAPWGTGGLLLLAGYWNAALGGGRRLADPELRRFVRAQQWRRLTFRPSLWR